MIDFNDSIAAQHLRSGGGKTVELYRRVAEILAGGGVLRAHPDSIAQYFTVMHECDRVALHVLAKIRVEPCSWMPRGLLLATARNASELALL